MAEVANLKRAGVACYKCGSPMKLSVEIQPFGRQPGLLAYECAACGAVSSFLVEPRSKSGARNRGTR